MPSIARLAWTAAAWEDTLHWQGQDYRQLRRINHLMQACRRDPTGGIGKPGPLRENLAGCWSRRIDDEHRVVYRLDGDLLVILACRYHDRCSTRDDHAAAHHAAAPLSAELPNSSGWAAKISEPV